MNEGVSFVRNPVRLISIFFGSGLGCCLSSRRPMAYSTTTSSSNPTSSVTFWAIQGLMTDKLIFRMSTFLSNSEGNFIDLRSLTSLSENLLS
jgi:hypothetical protein